MPPPAPRLRTRIPGPRSLELAHRLRAVESRNVTRIDPHGPIFWAAASGATVEDVDGNRFLDLTAGFGVTATGHANPAVADAVSSQVRRLPHAMGDVHPAEAKVALLERLAALAPGDLGVGLLSANGSDAVESAIKTAVLATGRTGIVAFHGAYHGLGYGALSVTGLPRFRGPFTDQLAPGVRFAPFPTERSAPSIDRVRSLIEESAESAHPVGAVIVEPIQGRAGIRVPPPGFLNELRRLTSELGVLLIFDEIYTGLGRTGEWFACDHDGIVPDLLVLGKSLAGGLPLSVVLGSRELMAAWPESEGEALHTSTFLGNPVTCAAALANLREIERQGLVARAANLGERVQERLSDWVESRAWAAEHRGRGLMQALVVAGHDAPDRAVAASRGALQRGVIVLSEGDAIALTPPLVITETELDRALDLLEESLDATG